MWTRLASNWQQILFLLTGFGLLGLSVRFLLAENPTMAVTAFVMAFLCFVFGQLSRFKRFKGFGMEAELWEDKQKEAAELIERLKSIVSVYTHEILVGRVSEGRWGEGGSWAEHWKLFDDLTAKHTELGQVIDFKSTKYSMDTFFLFDMANNQYAALKSYLRRAKGQVPPTLETAQTKALNDHIETRFDFMNLSENRKIGETLSSWFDKAARELENIGSPVYGHEAARGKLQKITDLERLGPIPVTAETVTLADGGARATEVRWAL